MSAILASGRVWLRCADPASVAEQLPSVLRSGFFTDIAITRLGLVAQITAPFDVDPLLAAYEWKNQVRTALRHLGDDVMLLSPPRPAQNRRPGHVDSADPLETPWVSEPGAPVSALPELRASKTLRYTPTVVFSVSLPAPVPETELAKAFLAGALGRAVAVEPHGDHRYQVRFGSVGPAYALAHHPGPATWTLTTDGTASVSQLWERVREGAGHIGLQSYQGTTHMFWGDKLRNLPEGPAVPRGRTSAPTGVRAFLERLRSTGTEGGLKP